MDDFMVEAVEARYNSEQKSVPYRDEKEYIQDLTSLVSLYLVSAVAYKGALEEELSNGDEDRKDFPNLAGTTMSLGEAMQHVSCYPEKPLQTDFEIENMVSAARAHIKSRLAATNASGLVLRLERLKMLLELSDFSFFCIACAIACALDRGFERLFVSLHGDVNLPLPTLGAINACYSLAHPARCIESGWTGNQSSAENLLLFLPPLEHKPPLLRPVVLRPDVLAYILGEPYRSRELADFSDVIDSEAHGEPLFIDSQIRRVRLDVRQMCLRGEPRLCILCGAAGSGKKLTLQKLSAEEQVRFLLVRLDELSESTYDVIDELVAASLLWGCIPCFSLENAAQNPLLPRILAALRPYNIGAVLLTKQLRSNIVIDGYLVSRIDYPAPSLVQSLHFWQLFASGYETHPALDWTQLASKYTLTPGQIKSAFHTAGEMAEAEDEFIDAAKIDAAILLGNTGRLSEIADKITVFYTWDDLVLGDASKQLLRDACNRIKYRHMVETQWGFGEKFAYGGGVSILLYGPPGTGKTMSAQVIAGELGLPLYRINLAQIISKYIGETAKNLDAVFSEAKSSNVILFFDEADALFSKRTDVKNSNDRHANSESSYLLQKIEEYAGVSILATNLANNFDEAFRRRIGYMVNIHMPSAAQRLELWRNSIPPKAPISPDADLQLFADNLEFSGSVIKSAALQAAYFAADENTQISMIHIARAVRRELQKLGKSEPHFLTMYNNTKAN